MLQLIQLIQLQVPSTLHVLPPCSGSRSDDVLYFSYYQQILWRTKSNHALIHLIRFVFAAKPWYGSFLCAKEPHRYHWGTLLYWVTCFFIIMNVGSGGYFDLIPHMPSCCCRRSLVHQIHSWKLFPYTYTSYPFWAMFAETYSIQLFWGIFMPFFFN